MIGMKELLIVLVVVLLVFGTKKLRNLGGDLGSSLRDFKKAMSDGEKDADEQKKTADQLPDEQKDKQA